MTAPVILVAPTSEAVRMDANEAACDRAISALVATLPALRTRVAAIERIRDDWAAYLRDRDAPSMTTEETT